MATPSPAQPPRDRAVWIAAVVGLAGGLMLSVPLSRILQGDQTPAALLTLGNPFGGWGGFGIQDVVVLGRDAAGSNTDTIFTLRVEGGRTVITQIPRDSYVNSDGFGAMKINGLLAAGGPDAVERELTRLMDRPIRHHVVVKLDAISTLADLVGGIEVDVPKRLYYVDRSRVGD